MQQTSVGVEINKTIISCNISTIKIVQFWLKFKTSLAKTCLLTTTDTSIKHMKSATDYWEDFDSQPQVSIHYKYMLFRLQARFWQADLTARKRTAWRPLSTTLLSGLLFGVVDSEIHKFSFLHCSSPRIICW